MIYAARLDIFAKVTTAAVSLLLVGMTYFFVLLALNSPIIVQLILYLVAMGLLVILLLCYLYSPLSYQLTEEAFEIKRRLSPVIIPFGEILRVELINETFVQDMERAGGNGGVFGYYGQFKAGRDIYQLYVTRMCGTVLVTTRDGRRVVISPDNPSLVTRLKERLQS